MQRQITEKNTIFESDWPVGLLGNTLILKFFGKCHNCGLSLSMRFHILTLKTDIFFPKTFIYQFCVHVLL